MARFLLSWFVALIMRQSSRWVCVDSLYARVGLADDQPVYGGLIEGPEQCITCGGVFKHGDVIAETANQAKVGLYVHGRK